MIVGKYTVYVEPEDNEDSKKATAVKEVKDQAKDASKGMDEIDLTNSDDESSPRKSQKAAQQETPRAATGKQDPRKRQDTPRPPARPGDQPASSGPFAGKAATPSGQPIGQGSQGQPAEAGGHAAQQKTPPLAKPAVPILKPVVDPKVQLNTTEFADEQCEYKGFVLGPSPRQRAY